VLCNIQLDSDVLTLLPERMPGQIRVEWLVSLGGNTLCPILVDCAFLLFHPVQMPDLGHRGGISLKYETIVILCAHHSGSSAVAGALHHMGVEMTAQPKRKDGIHPHGIWERGGFMQLNNKILGKAGGSWLNPPPVDKILALDFSKEIKKLVSSIQAKPWGWKDPRTALTAELWHPHLVGPFYIVVEREIEAVALSYEHYKSKFGKLDDPWELAETYCDRIDKFTTDKPHFHIWYEELLSFPRLELGELADELGLKLTEEAVKIVDPSCRHF